MQAAQHPRIVAPTTLRALSHKPPQAAGIASSATIGDAVRNLAELDVEALAVIDDERFSGTFSQRDFVRFMADGGNMNAPVSDAMTSIRQVAGPNDAVEHWLEKTKADGIAYLPVLDGSRLLGLLSRADLLAESDAHHRRVYEAMDLDQRIMFKRGTYSC